MKTTRRYSRSPLKLLMLAATAVGFALVVGVLATLLVPRQSEGEARARALVAERQAARDRAELAALAPRIERAQEQVAPLPGDGAERQSRQNRRPEVTPPASERRPAEKPKPAERSRAENTGRSRVQPKPAPPTTPPPPPAAPTPTPAPAAPVPARPSSQPNRPDRPKPATGEFGP